MPSFKKTWRRLEVRLQKTAAVQTALKRLYSGYVNFVFRTTRWEWIGLESLEADIARGVPRVLCCWHERLIFVTYLRNWADHPFTVLASRHADARIATANMARRGITVIELATSGDNSAALRRAVRAVRAGGSLGVAVDGPLGPARVTKPGALAVAGLAGVDVAPFTYAISRKLRLRTWDSHVLPLPFSRGVLAVGDGFRPPPRLAPADMAAACDRLGTLIDELTTAAEARLSEHRRS